MSCASRTLVAQGDNGLSWRLNRVHARTNNTDRELVRAFTDISRICDTLKLTVLVKNSAQEIFKDQHEVR